MEVTKKILTSIISNKGICKAGGYLCSRFSCILMDTCITKNAPYKYKEAIKIYIEMYGKEDLVEVLI